MVLFMENNKNKNKNGFLITWGVCIILLLALCFFGTNSSSVLKGTSAAGAYQCASGETAVAVYNESGTATGEYACCPSGYTAKAYTSYVEGTYWCQKANGSGTSQGMPTCDFIFTLSEIENNYNSGLACVGGYKPIGDGTAKCTLFDAEDAFYLEDDYTPVGKEEIIDIGISDLVLLKHECTAFSRVSAQKRYCYLEQFGNGNKFHWITESEAKNKGLTDSDKKNANNEIECLEKTNMSGYLCVAENDGTSGYMWINDTSERYGNFVEQDYITIDVSISSESACLAKNACYKFLQPYGAGWKYIWGYAKNLNNLTPVTEYTTKESCLDAAKDTPNITLSKSNMTIESGRTDTFTVTSDVAGKVSVVSATSSVATVTPGTSNLSSNSSSKFTVTAISNGTSKIKVIFTPTDTTKYRSVEKTVTVTVNDNGIPEKKDPKITITPASLAVTEGNKVSFTFESDIAGGISISNSNENVAGVDPETQKISANQEYTITVEGLSKGTSTLTIDFVPGDSSKYNSVEKTVTVTVKESTSGGGTTTKTDPTVTLSPTALTVKKGKNETFTVKPNVAGTISVTSGSTNYATVTVNKTTLAANESATVTVNGVAVGSSTITVQFTPTDTSRYNPKSVPLTATITESTSGGGTTNTVSVPSCNSSLVYNGTSQTLVNSGTGYTLTGASQKNAGNYTVVAKLASGYKWSDGSTSDKDISCSISKATANITVNASVSVKYPDKETIGFSYNGDGSVTCSSADTSIATCEVKDGELIISSKAKGSTSITLSASAGNNYNATSKKINVEVTKTTGGGGSNLGDDENPKTGEITIAIIWFLGIFAVAYAFFYYRKAREN